MMLLRSKWSPALALVSVLTAASGAVVGCARIGETTRDGAEAVVEPNDDTDAIRRVCPSRRGPDGKWVVVEGMDVSDYEVTVWPKVVLSAPQFKWGFARTSAGLIRKDTRFVPDWRGMKEVGLIRGAYQYFKPSQSAIKQAELYVEMINAEGGLLPDDMPPVFDLETTNGMPIETVKCRSRLWLARVERATRRIPIVYSSAQHNDLLGPELARYPLWVANYVGTPQETCPRTPDAWPRWTIWQHTDKFKTDGVYSNIDRHDAGAIEYNDAGPVKVGFDANYFDGTMADLKRLIANSISTGDVPDPTPPANPPHVTQVDGGEVMDCSDGCCTLD